MHIHRTLQASITAKLGKGKAIVLIGPRQAGKTTLLKNILGDSPHLFLDADDPTVRSLLTNPNTEQIRRIIGGHGTVFIDEAQRVENIGLTLKIITDQFKHVQLLVSGSSAFELANRLNEPLTGRKWAYRLLPVSWNEFERTVGFVRAEQELELRLLYGMYPEVLATSGAEAELLKELTSSYLYKDVLSSGGIRRPDVLEKLVQALALQLGSEVSQNELAQLVGTDKNTIGRYIDLLEQTFVIFRLKSYSNNLRNEIKAGQKIYFYDNGIRNMSIGNFRPLALRQDKGALWENFLLAERVKKLNNEGLTAKPYFWRTVQQQEIDYVEEQDGLLTAYEIKWRPQAGASVPKTFADTYRAAFQVVHRENFRSFL